MRRSDSALPATSLARARSSGLSTLLISRQMRALGGAELRPPPTIEISSRPEAWIPRARQRSSDSWTPVAMTLESIRERLPCTISDLPATLGMPRRCRISIQRTTRVCGLRVGQAIEECRSRSTQLSRGNRANGFDLSRSLAATHPESVDSAFSIARSITL